MQIKAGSTDVSIDLYIMDTTTGGPLTGLVYNSAGMDLWYRLDGQAKVSITEATLAALSSTHADGGFKEIANGWYRLDLPDAAVAAGNTRSRIGGTVTGGVVFGPCIELTGQANGIPANNANANVTADMQELDGDDAPTSVFGEIVNEALIANGLDHLVLNPVAGADVGDDSIIAKLVSKSATADWDTYANTTDSIQALADAGLTSGTFAANAITSTVVADNFLTAAKIATGAIDADALAADAVTEIATGVAAPSAATIAAAVAAKFYTEAMPTDGTGIVDYSLGWMLLAQCRFAISGNNLLVKAPDGTTIGTIVMTRDPTQTPVSATAVAT